MLVKYKQGEGEDAYLLPTWRNRYLPIPLPQVAECATSGSRLRYLRQEIALPATCYLRARSRYLSRYLEWPAKRSLYLPATCYMYLSQVADSAT